MNRMPPNRRCVALLALAAAPALAADARSPTTW